MRKKIIISIIILLNGVFAYSTFNIKFDNSRWLPKDDPVEILEKYTEKTFDQHEELIIAIKLKKDFFSPDIFISLINLEEQIKQKINITKMTSPLNVSLLIKEKPKIINITTLKKQYKDNQSTISQLKKYFKKSYYYGRYISNDFKSFLILIRPQLTENALEQDRIRSDLNEKISQLLKNHPIFSNFKMAGKIKLHHELNIQNHSELKRLIPTIFLFIIAFLGFYYASRKILFIIILSASTTLMGSFFVFYILGIPLNMLTSIVPLLITAISISDSVHIINSYFYLKKLPDFNIKKLMKFTWRPCLITTLTTGIGFLSFNFSNLLAIKQLSIVAPCAILLSYLIIIGTNWSLLYLLNPSSFPYKRKIKLPAFLFNFKRSSLKIITTCSLLIISGFIVYRFSHIETNLLDSFFKRSSPIQRDFGYIDKYHGGTGSFDLIIARKSGNTNFKSIDTYQKILRLVETLEKEEYIERMESYIMPVRMVHQKLATKKKGAFRDPATSEALAQELLFLEFSQTAQDKDILRPFLSFDGKNGRLVFRTKNLSNIKANELKGHLLKNTKNLPFSTEFSGNNEYFLRLSRFILDTQLSSLLSTLMAIFLLMGFFYTFKISLVAVIANLFPISVVMASIVLTQTPFDFSTILISSICLGISIDNSIHLLHHIFTSLDNPDAFSKNFFIALNPIAVVTIIFIGVFAFFATSHIVLLQRFGLFSALMIIVSFISNICLVPSFCGIEKKS